MIFADLKTAPQQKTPNASELVKPVAASKFAVIKTPPSLTSHAKDVQKLADNVS